MTNNFFSIEETKDILKINDNVEDAVLSDFGKSADIDLEDYIKQFYSNLPFESQEITRDMVYAVIYDVCMHYKLRNNNYEAANEYNKLRNQRRESIKKSFLNSSQKQSSYAVIF